MRAGKGEMQMWLGGAGREYGMEWSEEVASAVMENG